MTLYEFMNLCVADTQVFEVFDCTKEKVVWRGTIDDLPEKIEDCEVMSYDAIETIDSITVNIESEYYE